MIVCLCVFFLFLQQGAYCISNNDETLVLYKFDFVDADAILGMELKTTALNIARSWSIFDLEGVSGRLEFLPDGERLQKLWIDDGEEQSVYEFEYGDDDDVIQLKSCNGPDCPGDNRYLKQNNEYEKNRMDSWSVQNSFPTEDLSLNYHHNQQRQLEDFSYLKLDCKFCGPISDSMCKTLVGRSCQVLGMAGGFGVVGGIVWGEFCNAITTLKCSPEPGCPGDQYCECERGNQKRCGGDCVSMDTCCPPIDYQCPDDPNVCILEGSQECCPAERCGGVCPEMGAEICCGGQLVPSYTGLCDTCDKRQVCRDEFENAIGCVQENQCCPPYALEPCNGVCYDPTKQVCCEETGELREQDYLCSCDVVCHDANGNELSCAGEDGCCSDGTAESSLDLCNCQGQKFCYDSAYNVIKCIDPEQDCTDEENDEDPVCPVPSRRSLLNTDNRALQSSCVYDSDCQTLGCLPGEGICVDGQLGENCYYSDNRLCQPGLFCVSHQVTGERVCLDGSLGACCDNNADCTTLGCLPGKNVCVDGQVGENCYYDNNDLCQPGLFCVWSKVKGDPNIRRGNRVCLDGSLGEECDNNADCTTLGCLPGKNVCVDGQVGENCYYDNNDLCQPGLVCVGERREDRVCQEEEESRSSMPTTPERSPNPTAATNTPPPTIPPALTPNPTAATNTSPPTITPVTTSTTMPTIAVPVNTQSPNSNPTPSNKASPPPTTSGVSSSMPNSPVSMNPPSSNPDPGLGCGLPGCADGSESPSISTAPSESTYPSISPSVSDSPSESVSPSLSPTVATPGGFCFSGDNYVETRDKGLVQMRNLSLGDWVRVANQKHAKYEPIYSFGHKNDNVETEYLSISTIGIDTKDTTSKNESLYTHYPLEITQDHMIMLPGGRFVPAYMLKNGDTLMATVAMDHNNDKIISIKMVKITMIRRVVRKGSYAPFTPSGTIVVNGIVSSNYICYGVHFSTTTFHRIAHAFNSVHRLVWRVTDYKEETYTEDGISQWVAIPHRILLGVFWQRSILQFLIVVVLFPLLCFVLFLAQLVEELITMHVIFLYCLLFLCVGGHRLVSCKSSQSFLIRFAESWNQWFLKK